MEVINKFGLVGELTINKTPFNMVALVSYTDDSKEEFKFGRDEDKDYIINDLKDYYGFNRPIILELNKVFGNKRVGLYTLFTTGDIEVFTNEPCLNLIKNLVAYEVETEDDRYCYHIETKE